MAATGPQGPLWERHLSVRPQVGRECVHRAEYQIQEHHLLSEEIKWISASTVGKEGVVKYAGRLFHGSELFEEDPFLQLLSPTPLSANLGSSTCCISQESWVPPH